ncbi:hypothetical protein D3C75_759330 [compost metagenome]
MGGGALDQGAEEDDGIAHPDHGDGDVNGPLQLGILLGSGVSQRQCDGGGEYDRLPAPEHEGGERAAKQPDLAGTLYHVEGGGHQRTAAKCKDDRIGVQGAQAAVGQPGGIKVEGRPDQLGCDQYTNRHTDNSPDNRHDGELAHNGVVVLRVVCCMAHRCIPLPMLLFVFRPVIGAIFTPDLQNPLVNIC